MHFSRGRSSLNRQHWCLLAPHLLHFHKKAKNWTYNRIWREIYQLNKNLRWRILREKCKNGLLAPSNIKTGNRKTEAQSAVTSEPTSCGHYRVLHKQRRSNSNCCGVWFIPLIKYLSIRVLFYFLPRKPSSINNFKAISVWNFKAFFRHLSSSVEQERVHKRVGAWWSFHRLIINVW